MVYTNVHFAHQSIFHSTYKHTFCTPKHITYYIVHTNIHFVHQSILHMALVKHSLCTPKYVINEDFSSEFTMQIWQHEIWLPQALVRVCPIICWWDFTSWKDWSHVCKCMQSSQSTIIWRIRRNWYFAVELVSKQKRGLCRLLFNQVFVVPHILNPKDAGQSSYRTDAEIYCKNVCCCILFISAFILRQYLRVHLFL